MTSDRLQPALWGGLFIGVLSSLPFVNCCCCLWVIAGGALAVYVRQQNMPLQIDASEGALVGLLAGLAGGIIAAVLTVAMIPILAPLQGRLMEWALSANPDFPSDLRDRMLDMSRQRGLSIVRSVIAIFIDTIFGMLGGLLGVAIFKKNAPPPPPPGTVELLPPQ